TSEERNVTQRAKKTQRTRGGIASGAGGSDWPFAGSLRARSGFPITPGNGFNFPTNFELTPPGTLIGKVKTSVTQHDPNGFPNLFKDPAAAAAQFEFTRPGGSGTRNGLDGHDGQEGFPHAVEREAAAVQRGGVQRVQQRELQRAVRAGTATGSAADVRPVQRNDEQPGGTQQPRHGVRVAVRVLG